MNVTREVVRDLLTVYLSGDASDDTRALVEEFLERDPLLKAEAEAARAGGLRLPTPPAPIAPESAEKRALDRTRDLMKTRTSTLVMAVLFTMLPFTFAFSGSQITFLLIRDAPVIAAAWWATAAVMWVWHVRVRRRLTVTGL
jgi:anti-sigma factor RsiW